MEEAIKRALKGGWNDTDYAFTSKEPPYEGVECQIGEWQYDVKVFLDPLFWQALGKAEGWEEKTYYEINCQARNYQTYEETSEITWKLQMHCLIDHLIGGKDVESFFGELLAKE